VPAFESGGPGESFGWLDPVSGVITPAGGDVSGYPFAVGDAFLFARDLDGESTVVLERPGDEASIPLPGTDVELWQATPRGPRALLWASNLGPEPPLLVDFEDATAKVVADAPGLYRFGADASAMQGAFDDSGALLRVLRDDHTGGVFRSDDAGATWERLGSSFSHVWDIGVADRGGTWVLTATDEEGFFEMKPWLPAPNGVEADHVGPGVEVVRPADGIVRSLDEMLPAPWYPSTISISSDGACVAFVEHVDDARSKLKVLDVLSDRRAEVLETESVTWTAAVWLE
jgi:hypothetical protein